jgi:hypothetical protein
MAHKYKKRWLIKHKDLTKGINTASEVVELLKLLEEPKLQEQGVTGLDRISSELIARVEEHLANLKGLEPEKDDTNSNTSSAKVINPHKNLPPKRI